MVVKIQNLHGMMSSAVMQILIPANFFTIQKGLHTNGAFLDSKVVEPCTSIHKIMEAP
jgi:hypothetical protein